MDVKIAVASSDGTHVDLHFGRSKQFLIYRLHDDGYDLLETRDNIAPCSGHEHHNDILFQSVERLSDCRGVIVAQIGAGAIDALITRKIFAFTLPGTIREAFEVVINSKRFATSK